MKLVVLLSRVPWPLEKGDKLRAYHQLRHLSKLHDVCLICLTDQPTSDEATEKLKEVCSELHVLSLSKPNIALRMIRAGFSDKPFQIHYFYQNKIQREINRILLQFKPEHIFCQLIRTAEYVKHYHSCKKTIDFMDALSAGLRRRSTTAPWWQKNIIAIEAHRLLNYEHLIFDYFEHHSIISKQDKQLIFHPKQESIAVIPNGVDCEYYTPCQKSPNFQLLFTGNMSYPPNVDGAKRLALEILPLVHQHIPNAKLLIAGATPSSEVLQLESPHVKITGWVNDMREAYRDASIFIAPMRIGSGMQNKLLESMSMGMPCITTSLAANALEAAHNKELLVFETNEELAAAVVQLLGNPELCASLGEHARKYVLANHDWGATVADLNLLFTEK
jgi:sugar transferase (PEP-CTERM/EpsH1 system associated)